MSAVAEEPHRLADFSESESAKCRHVGLVIDLAATDDTLVPGRRRQIGGPATEDLGKAAEGRSIVVAKGAIRNEPEARPAEARYQPSTCFAQRSSMFLH
jgi:hypothetical protein